MVFAASGSARLRGPASPAASDMAAYLVAHGKRLSVRATAGRRVLLGPGQSGWRGVREDRGRKAGRGLRGSQDGPSVANLDAAARKSGSSWRVKPGSIAPSFTTGKAVCERNNTCGGSTKVGDHR